MGMFVIRCNGTSDANAPVINSSSCRPLTRLRLPSNWFADKFLDLDDDVADLDSDLDVLDLDADLDDADLDDTDLDSDLDELHLLALLRIALGGGVVVVVSSVAISTTAHSLL